MSEHAASAAVAGPANDSWLADFLDRYHFLLRRLHSLSGIVPVGAFVAFHLFTNMQMFFGSFQHEVNWIHSQPALFMMEVGVLWLPIAFHAALGTVYTFGGRPNNIAYGYAANWRYTIQRVTGIVALVFIFFHVAIMRWRWDLAGWYTPFFSKGIAADGTVVDLAQYSTAIALANIGVLTLYAVGALACIFHLANGVWTAAITWGLTITVQAQKRWGYICTAVFVALTLFSALALFGARTYAKTAPAQEKAAYAHMKDLYQGGQLPFERIEEISLAPTGSVHKLEK